MHPVGEVTYFG